MLLMAISLSFVTALCIPLLNITLDIMNLTMHNNGEKLIDEIERGINYVLTTLKPYSSNVTVPEGFEIWSKNDTLYIKYYGIDGEIKTYKKSFSFEIQVTPPSLSGRYKLEIWLESSILLIVFKDI